jgi:hypothetical protein
MNEVKHVLINYNFNIVGESENYIAATLEIRKVLFHVIIQPFNDVYKVSIKYYVKLDKLFYEDFVEYPKEKNELLNLSSIKSFFIKFKKDYNSYYENGVKATEYQYAKTYFFTKPNFQTLGACQKRLHPSNYERLEYEYIEVLKTSDTDTINSVLKNKICPLSLFDKAIEKLQINQLFFIANQMKLVDYRILERLKGTQYEKEYKNLFKLSQLYKAIQTNVPIPIDKFIRELLFENSEFIENVCATHDTDFSKLVLRTLRSERPVSMKNGVKFYF